MNYRHGDINLHEITEEEWCRVKEKGKRLNNSKSHILARGEATGSVHELTADGLEVYELAGVVYVRSERVGTLTHTTDHETIVIQPKPYRQVPEREVDHFADVVRRVVD